MSSLTHHVNSDDINSPYRFLHYQGGLSYLPLHAIFNTPSSFTKNICYFPCAWLFYSAWLQCSSCFASWCHLW